MTIDQTTIEPCGPFADLPLHITSLHEKRIQLSVNGSDCLAMASLLVLAAPILVAAIFASVVVWTFFTQNPPISRFLPDILVGTAAFIVCLVLTKRFLKIAKNVGTKFDVTITRTETEIRKKRFFSQSISTFQTTFSPQVWHRRVRQDTSLYLLILNPAATNMPPLVLRPSLQSGFELLEKNGPLLETLKAMNLLTTSIAPPIEPHP